MIVIVVILKCKEKTTTTGSAHRSIWRVYSISYGIGLLVVISIMGVSKVIRNILPTPGITQSTKAKLS